MTLLPPKAGTEVKNAIRNFCRNKRNSEGLNMYQLANRDGVGLEECEEMINGLIRDGFLKLYYTKRSLYLGFPNEERRTNNDRRKN